MRSALPLTAVLALALAAPAMAQSTGAASPTTGNTTSSTTGSTATNSTQPGAMAEAVKHDLSQAGFTDIQVMPSSFLVRAKDKAGRPVMMVINPDSVTEVTDIGKTTDSTKK